MKKSIIEKLGLNKLWEVLIIITVVTFSYTFIFYLLNRFSVVTSQNSFPRFVIIIVLTLIFYTSFYSPKVILRFKYFGSIFFVYLTTLFLTSQCILYFDQTLKADFVEIDIQQQTEDSQILLAKKNRTFNVGNSYEVMRNTSLERLSLTGNIKSYLISLVMDLLLCYVFTYFFTYKSFKQFNSHQN